MSIWKEPFLHFALLGAAIFGWFFVLNPDAGGRPEVDEIVVSERVFEGLSARFFAQMKRVPTPEEAQVMVDQFVRDEVLVREAQSLGLDQGDGVVRNRLVQKMAFLIASAAQSAMPDDAVLDQHLQENPETFKTPALISFEQIGLAPGTDAAQIEHVLSDLNAGNATQDEMSSSLLHRSMSKATWVQVDGNFGRGTFAQLETLPVGQWSGPVTSGYGLHAVRVLEYQASELPSLDMVRERVLADWRSSLADDLRTAQEAALLQAYQVSQPTQDTLKSWIGQ
ncbi:peptidylprolyl isomerase [Shimia sagamensis]|uniref:PPIC-type PPIASE domain-containing protein n=1 Tax=Shimia sagamensis TaxID=1566352 RepID=A0ABY1NIJ9_9RHOB|nr:peptidylprolyl isomerase [Shimia sagamensis]SMP09814.1 PPIC-type PPIASE domain-containing protein [Shimia sagamensis]